jgi:Protein of unknown function (DUF3147)
MLVSFAAKFLAGGTLVCLFALISQVCQPKQFAGIFAAAPSVLLAGLAITLVAQGTQHAMLTAQGAIAGAVGMIVYCLLATPAIQRYQALKGSGLALLGWVLVSGGAYVLLRAGLGW